MSLSPLSLAGSDKLQDAEISLSIRVGGTRHTNWWLARGKPPAMVLILMWVCAPAPRCLVAGVGKKNNNKCGACSVERGLWWARSRLDKGITGGWR